MTHSLGLNNLLEWLPELEGRFHLLDHLFTIKGYNSGTARWKGPTGQGMGKGQGASVPFSGGHSLYYAHIHQPGSSLNPVFLGFHGGFITQAS